MRRRNSTIWVNMYNYRWAPKRWPDRDVRISRYLAIDELQITKPGYLHNKHCKRIIRMDMDFVDKRLRESSLAKPVKPMNPQRGVKIETE